MREDMTRAEMVEKCRRDRDKLTRKMMALYPEFEGQMPSAWIEDLIPSLCGFRVDTFPLPKGQLGICDVGNRPSSPVNNPDPNVPESARYQFTATPVVDLKEPA